MRTRRTRRPRSHPSSEAAHEEANVIAETISAGRVVDVGDRDIENEFDDYESEEEYDEVDSNTPLVVVSSPPASPGPLSENTTASTPARKRKSAKPAAGATTDQAAEVGVDPEEQRSRRRRR